MSIATSSPTPPRMRLGWRLFGACILALLAAAGLAMSLFATQIRSGLPDPLPTLAALALVSALLPGLLLFGFLRWRFVRPLNDLQEALEQVSTRERREVLLNEKVRRSERMASIGQLAAGIAHEINNPMSYIASNVNRLADFSKQLSDISERSLEGGSGPRLMAEINEIIEELQDIAVDTCEGVARVTEIVAALREFSHGGPADGAYTWIDLNRVIRNCLTLIQNEIKHRADVHLELKPLPRVRCHPTQVGQVLLNLITNAAQAMDERGDILITTLAAEDRVHIVVEDNGCGIPEAQLPKIFDPFFTTKQVGIGTGLGLSVSHKIIQQHGGALWVDSLEGQGTRFLIELMRDGPEQEEPHDDEDAPSGFDRGA